MASSRRRVPTYHVAPHFNIPATGPLRLGTVVKDLIELAPLNKKEADRQPIPDDEIITPEPQTGFRETRSQLISGRFGVWAKVLGLKGLGGHGSAGGEQRNEETFSCDSITTTYFDPTDEWVSKCLSVKPVDGYIAGSGYKKEVFIITGLKIAKNLKFNQETAREADVDAKVEVNIPEAVAVGGSVEGNVSKDHTLEFSSTDIVVGIRVHKYRYKGRLLSSEKHLDGKMYVKGAEMLDSNVSVPKKLNQFERVPIEEEDRAQEAQEQEGEMEECWVYQNRTLQE
ncbi:hypothetical protein F4774DRAFT_385514 [Daldinia eschscholtzii]|nr:hypothetical protein F4774DRAFT_385514 [Daldinia eschscholtzii]